MKNIHLLPTDKPSRIVIKPKGTVFLSKTYFVGTKHKFNIYITSNEEIKEGDWLLYGASEIIKIELPINKNSEHFKMYGMGARNKIILTTDVELIKDGVQAIDDDELEWFVKNSSCEWVDVKYQYLKEINDTGRYTYKIIIPKDINILELGQITKKGIIDTIGNCANCGVEFHKDVKESKQKSEKNYYQEISDIVHENQGNLGDITDEIYKWFKKLNK